MDPKETSVAIEPRYDAQSTADMCEVRMRFIAAQSYNRSGYFNKSNCQQWVTAQNDQEGESCAGFCASKKYRGLKSAKAGPPRIPVDDIVLLGD